MEKTKSEERSSFLRRFIDHPASVDETYLEHALFAFKFSLTLFGAASAALVHAIIPPLFETTASSIIKKLCKQMEERH